LSFTAAHLRQTGRSLSEQQVDLPGQQVLHRGRAAAIGDELETRAGHCWK
jgi:hypothetical protein